MATGDDIDDLEEAVKKLRISYEKYFAGLDRIEPMDDRERVKALLRRLRSEQNASTARRFRLQQIQASLVTHEMYWNRICRQIEEGTYKRDRLRAQKLMEKAGKVAGDAAKAPETAAAPEAAAAAVATPAGTSAKPKPSAAAAGPGTPEPYPSALRQLHDAYNDAQRQLGATPITIASLAQTVAKQTAAIRAKYNCKDVEFKVAMKEGKAILKAIPR